MGNYFLNTQSFDPSLLTKILAPFQTASQCWIAFSGGCDSRVLLESAACIRNILPYDLRVIHIDHGLHPDSHLWATWCHDCCTALAISCLVKRVTILQQPGLSLEAQAREARYQACTEVLSPGGILLTAHTQDDQAETLLLALLRGSGVAGLAAMPEVTTLGAGLLVRPLLTITRAAILQYAQQQNLNWLEDPSNLELRFDRNYLRQRILPILRARWPATTVTFARSANHCAEAMQLIDQLAEQNFVNLSGERPGTLAIPALQKLTRPLQQAIIRRWLIKRGFSTPDLRHLERILSEVMTARSDANPVVSWAGCEIRRYRQDLFAIVPLPSLPITQKILWTPTVNNPRVNLPNNLGYLLILYPFDFNQKNLQFWISFGLPGLKCQALNTGKTRMLKKIFQEAGVPVWLRPFIPLVGKDNILFAIAGVYFCQAWDQLNQGSSERVDLIWREHPWQEFGIRSHIKK